MSAASQGERDPKRATKNYHSELDRDSLNKTRGRHADLNDMIANLSDKLTVVSNSQEKEFLSAYRVHMLGVQLELKELKLKVAKAELSLQDDGEVSKLEDECNWFRTETNRLNTHCSSMQSDITSMKNRLTTLRDQNEFLSSQLKAVMKRSRVIEVELEYNQQEREDRRRIMGSTGGEEMNEEGEEDAFAEYGDLDLDVMEYKEVPMTGNNLGKSESAIQLSRPKSKPGKKTKKLKRAKSHGSGVRLSELPPSDVLKQAPGKAKRENSPKEEQKDDFMSFGMSKEEKNRLGDPVKLAKHLRQLNEIRDKQSFVEVELEECLKMKFEEVMGRRSATVMENSKNRYIKKIAKSVDGSNTMASDMSSAMLETLESASFNSAVPNEKSGNPVYGGISGLGLEYLTDSDRKEVMTNLLSNPDVFREVVRRLQEMFYADKYGSAR
mmetsp:Transcript_36292/g.67624  ORF Transcript_36292/g.67624 Transcript_36292/m.67624 type:complete len:439 (-) Transcript_36292:10-1326(-)